MMQGKAHLYITAALFVSIMAFYLVLAVHFPFAYVWATYEDLYGEWTQTYLFAAALVVYIMLAARPSRDRWFFVLLAMVLFYVVMEEISWGQRLLGFESPDFFQRHNLQGEANIHNLLVGPVGTTTKGVIGYGLACGLVLYGLVYPLLLKLNWTLATRLRARGLVAPPLYLWPFFVSAAFLETGLLNFNEAEIAEILIAFALAVMGAHYWFLRQSSPVADKAVSRRLALASIGVLVVAVTLAAATTRALYAVPEKKAEIDSRIFNGYEKFAERYERFGRWETAARLYLAVHHNEAHRTSILRRLAHCYKQMDDQAAFLRYNQLALDIALRSYANNPESVATHLSLARSYLQRDDHDRAQQYLLQAQSIARETVQEYPHSARHAYWLGRTYHAMGEYSMALAEYRRAFELKPDSSRYRKAYYRMRTRVGAEG